MLDSVAALLFAACGEEGGVVKAEETEKETEKRTSAAMVHLSSNIQSVLQLIIQWMELLLFSQPTLLASSAHPRDKEAILDTKGKLRISLVRFFTTALPAMLFLDRKFSFINNNSNAGKSVYSDLQTVANAPINTPTECLIECVKKGIISEVSLTHCLSACARSSTIFFIEVAKVIVYTS
jgi:hypothetical protein